MSGPHAGGVVARLREYQRLAPWSLRDLATLAAAILESASVRPISAAARTRPNQRTIRFYVTRGLVTAPDGRGPAATYGYRHLLQVLIIKLRQMEGASLATIAAEMAETTGDVIERRVATLLGPGVPPPDQLLFSTGQTPSRGRTGRVLDRHADTAEQPDSRAGATTSTWHRLPVEPGVELLVAHEHELVRREISAHRIAQALVHTIADLVEEPAPMAAAPADDEPEPAATARPP